MPTIGPALEMFGTQPLAAAKAQIEGKESHFLAREFQDAKGFIPFANLWYTKAATDHIIMQNIMETLSPGYLASMRAKTQKDYSQSWWWGPGELAPERAPDLGAAINSK